MLCSVFSSHAGSQLSQCLWKCATNIVAGAVRVLPRRPSSRAASAFCSPPWQWAVADCGADDEARSERSRGAGRAQALMGRGDAEVLQPGARLLVLGLGLLFLGRQDSADATLEVRRPLVPSCASCTAALVRANGRRVRVSVCFDWCEQERVW